MIEFKAQNVENFQMIVMIGYWRSISLETYANWTSKNARLSTAVFVW